MSTKQRMISAADMERLVAVPDAAKLTAVWLWLNLDPLGRGRADPVELSARMTLSQGPLQLSPDVVEAHLLMLMEAEFLSTYKADGCEWLLLLHPLKVDLRGTRITTPEPPRAFHGESVAMGGGRARERARAQVRAEDAARRAAWDAVRDERAEPEVMPERPLLLDAPPMFCADPEHARYGAGSKKCGPCRDARLVRDEWITRRVYEEKLAGFHEQEQDYDPEVPF